MLWLYLWRRGQLGKSKKQLARPGVVGACAHPYCWHFYSDMLPVPSYSRVTLLILLIFTREPIAAVRANRDCVEVRASPAAVLDPAGGAGDGSIVRIM